MSFFILGGIFIFLFIIFVYLDKRNFINGVFLVLSMIFLFIGFSVVTQNNNLINSLLLIFVYGMVPVTIFIISILLIINGFTMLKKEGKSFKNMLSLILGIVMPISLIIIIAYISYVKLPFILTLIMGLVILVMLYLSIAFIAFYSYSFLYRLMPKNKKCDYIIVHGCGLLDGNRVSNLLAGRINKGIEIYERSNMKAKIIVSGGKGSDETVSEAFAMKEYCLKKGIPECAIIMEDRSMTTLENLEFSKQIIEGIQQGKAYSCIFVTNDYHVFRTGMFARKVKLKAEGVGCKTAPYYWPSAFIREYIAIIVYFKGMFIIIGLIWLLLAINSIIPM